MELKRHIARLRPGHVCPTCYITGFDNVRRFRRLYHLPMTSRVWKASVRQLSRLKVKAPVGNWIVVRYKELGNEPETAIPPVCEVIDEDFEA